MGVAVGSGAGVAVGRGTGVAVGAGVGLAGTGVGVVSVPTLTGAAGNLLAKLLEAL